MTTRPPSEHARPSGTSSIASSSTSHHTLHVAGNADNAEGKAKKDKSRKTHQKIRLSKKAGSSGTGSSIRAVKTGAEEDDDWTFEGGEADPGMNGNSRVRESMEAVRELREPQSYAVAPIGGVQASSDQKDKERESKGRRLVKKTSQLFGRKDKDKDKDRDRLSSNPASSSSSVYLPMASRQSSKSSGESQEQMNRQRPLASRVPSGGSTMTTNGSALGGGFLGTRRPSQEAQAALGAYAGNGSGIGAIRPKPRTGSSSTYESSIDAPSPLLTSGPLPGTGQRRPSQLSNLSSSVSALPRPPTQPIPTSATQPQGPSVPTRMSAWFSGLISSSAGSETSTQSSEPTTSPLRPTGPSAAVTRGPSAAASFLNAARQKAVEGVRNLLDSEAQPDRCTEPIWLMGVSHPGYTPPLASPPFGQVTHHIGENGNGARPGSSGSGSGEGPLSTPPQTEREKGLRAGWQKRQMDRPPGSPAKGLGQLFGGSTVSLVGSPSKDGGRVEDSPSRGKKGKEREVLKWPEEFYTDFRSTVWCTYRSQYAPIISIPQDTLIPSAERYYAAFGPPADLQILHTDAAPEHNAQVPTSNGLSSKPSAWGWGRSEERGLTSDAGWGCMLRTGQSMLANALISLHLGRGWRVPLQPPSLEPTTPAELLAMQQYATYARILSYFQDDPSPLAPFSVHRMALIGKALGKEVGEWFGPSTAQGALKTLANAFPPCGLTVVGGIDGMVYRSEVIEASNADDGDWAAYNAVKDPESLGNGSSKHKQEKKGRLSKLYTDTGGDEGKWGKKAVLVLVGLRLGLDGVNPIYHDSIKTLFTFPQSVGIAGGRPSSSYYFVASQANSLFYLDPHFTRPAIPLEVPPSFTAGPNTDDTVKEATSTARTATQPKQTGSSSSASSPSLNQSDDFLASSVTVPASETVDNEEAILLPDMSASAILADERAQGAEPVPMQGQGPGYKPYKLDMVDVDDASSGSEPSFSPTRPPRSSAFAEGPKTNLVPPSTFVPPSTSRSSSMLSPPASPHVGYSRKSSAATTGTAEMRESDVFSAPIHAGKGARTGGIEVDAETRWYASAYAEAQLKTYHCDKVRKIPLSALDPSMLLGFLCRDEADFEDFCERVVRKIFSVLDEPPTWDDGASAGLESVSEPDFSSEDEDEDETDAIDSPLGDSLTLPNRNHNNLTIKPVVPRGRTLSTGSDEDLSATVRTLSVGMERDETVRGGLSGVVDSSGPHDGTKLGVEGDDDSLPPTPRVVAPPAFFSRPSVVLVERPEEDEPRNAIPRPSPSEADTVRR